MEKHEHIRVTDLRDIIVQRYSNAIRINDRAHQVGHFNAVEVCGNEINNRLQLGYDHKLIMLVAYFHDMFAWSRFNHHILSAQMIRTTDDNIIATLTNEERELVALGCEEHRASRKDPFTCTFSKLMNAADRELPGNVTQMLERAVQYRLQDECHDDDAESRLKVMPDAIAHIKHKFGEMGYASYPDIYLECFAEELAKQREEIKNL